MSKANPILGNYLLELRLQSNMSLRDVEKATNKSVSNAYLCQLESGKIAKPSVHILHYLSTVYKVPYEEIMGIAGYTKTSEKKHIKSGIAFFKKNDITNEEKRMLLQYLHFMRSKERKIKNEKR